MTFQSNTYAAVGKGMDVAGFGGRLAVYLFVSFVIYLVVVFGILISGPHGVYINTEPYLDNVYINSAITIILCMIPCILWEWRIRHFRRKHGLSIYKNIYEDLKQMKVDEQISREQKAYEKVQRNDISYWYDLLQKGAITKEDYDTKKKELL